MKKLCCMLALLLATCATLRAQNVNINNNVSGDVYVKVFAYQPGCSPFIDSSVLTFAAAGNSTLLDLNIASNWASGSVPVVPYEIVWSTVSRNPACPGSPGWGMIAGACWLGGNEYYDQAVVGDVPCGYNTHACLTVMITGSSCNGFAAGDQIQVDFIPGGPNADIDLNW